jgi:signal transduction histidine kinase
MCANGRTKRRIPDNVDPQGKRRTDRSGSIGQVLDRALKRQQELIDRSLAEVRLRLDPKVHKETASLLQVIEQLMVTAEVEASQKDQTTKIEVDPGLKVEADQYLLYSAVSNLVQNAIKYSCRGGRFEYEVTRLENKPSSKSKINAVA